MNNCDVEHEICPYDKSHMILKARMLTHLARCSKNYPNCEKQACIYNKKHIIPVLELKYHYASCPDRFKGDQFNYKVGDIECSVKTELPIAIDMPPSEENWDNDNAVGSVLEKIKEVGGDKNIILSTSAIGKSKTKRKEMRKMEMLRHQAIMDATKRPHQLPQARNVSENRVLDFEPIRAPKVLDNTSTQLQMRLKRNEDAARANNGVVGKKVQNQLSSRQDESVVTELSEDLKLNIRISSRSSDISDSSVISRISEKSAKSYASLLAERQRASMRNQSVKSQGLNNCDEVKTSASSSNGMQVLQSSIFDKGGRGWPAMNSSQPEKVERATVNLSPPTSVSSHASSSSVRLPINDINLLTDEHGFLHMPLPGKGRGKTMYS